MVFRPHLQRRAPRHRPGDDPWMPHRPIVWNEPVAPSVTEAVGIAGALMSGRLLSGLAYGGAAVLAVWIVVGVTTIAPPAAQLIAPNAGPVSALEDFAPWMPYVAAWGVAFALFGAPSMMGLIGVGARSSSEGALCLGELFVGFAHYPTSVALGMLAAAAVGLSAIFPPVVLVVWPLTWIGVSAGLARMADPDDAPPLFYSSTEHSRRAALGRVYANSAQASLAMVAAGIVAPALAPCWWRHAGGALERLADPALTMTWFDTANEIARICLGGLGLCAGLAAPILVPLAFLTIGIIHERTSAALAYWQADEGRLSPMDLNRHPRRGIRVVRRAVEGASDPTSQTRRLARAPAPHGLAHTT